MLQTKRLIIRPFEEKDYDAIFAMRSDAEVMRFIREPQTNIQETYNWVSMMNTHFEETGIGFMALVEKESHEFIGWCGLWILKESGEKEVGYGIRKESWGMGLATEAAERVVQYGFEDLGLERIVAVAVPENSASTKVMKKLGMKRVGIGRFYDHDLVQYGFNRDEWTSFRTD